MPNKKITEFDAAADLERNDSFVVARSGDNNEVVMYQMGDGSTFVVAASDANARTRAKADYICDGTDDNVQIQAAIDALPAVGGSVQLSEGTFYISSTIIVNKEMYLLGRGKAAVAPNRGTTLYLVNNSDTDILEITDAGSALYFMQIRGMKFNGNKANQASGQGIYAHGDVHDVVLRDLFIYNMKEQGVYVLDDGHRPHNFRVFGILIEECDGNGWEDNACDQLFMNFCYFYDNLRHLYSRGDYGIFQANHFYKSHRDNVLFSTGHYNIFEGNYVDGSGTVAASPGIQLANSDNCIVVGNFSGNAKGVDQTYGILLDAATSNCLVQSNCFTGNVTGGVSDAGAGNMIRNNQGYVTENSGTATILNGTTSIVVAHGLDETPSIEDISLVFGENPTNDPGNIWIDTIGVANFTINCRNNPGVSNLDVGWRIAVL